MKLNEIFLPHKKGTENSETLTLPCPETVRISMSQHMGAPCLPIVKVGDEVTVGQKIGDCDTVMCVPIHSSVSGTVTKIDDMILANGKSCKVVEITSDGKQTKCADIKRPAITDKKSLVKAVRESGCCGLGGAGFPTHVKLDYDEKKTPIDSLIINAAECEPYITSDYREMIENSDNVLEGIKFLKDILQIENVYIGIERNKPKAIKTFEQLTAGEENIKVIRLNSTYPQGAEKVISYTATGRIITEGTITSEHGIIVMNVSTVGFINHYRKNGVPLVSRRVTIDGDAVNTPCNIRVPIGTKISDILKFTDTNLEGINKLISGGPMMGVCLYDFDTPVSKTNNAFLAFQKSADIKNTMFLPVQTNCIRCGRCINACPLGLMPEALEKAYDKQDKDTLNKFKINLCMNCGSCTYVCPAKRNLAEKNQLAKGFALSK